MTLVRLIAKTVGAEDLIREIKDKTGKDESPDAQSVTSFITRVSNPNNQLNFDTADKLIKYCIKHAHWSPFEHAYFTFEITTSRGVAAQILRHRSFSFQEFSQRYQQLSGDCMITYEARRQDQKNRQNSIDDIIIEDKNWFIEAQKEVWNLAFSKYQEALKKGIAKECARFLLPLNTSTKLYMTGNIRSWIHYLAVRTDPSTQKEHRDIALQIRNRLSKEISDVAVAAGWTNEG